MKQIPPKVTHLPVKQRVSCLLSYSLILIILLFIWPMNVICQSNDSIQRYPAYPKIGDTVIMWLTQDYGQNATFHWYFGDSLDSFGNDTINHIYTQTGTAHIRVTIYTGTDTLYSDDYIIISDDSEECTCLNTGINEYVYNGSFECRTAEPTDPGQIPFACPWKSNENISGADLYSLYASNTSPYLFQLPISHFGIQVPYNTGFLTGYVGFAAERQENATTTGNKLREYFYQELNQPLTPGITYHVSMKVSLAEGSTIYCPVGMYLTNEDPANHVFPANQEFYTNIPASGPNGFLVQTSQNIGEYLEWYEISGYITPTTSDIQYIVISKFNDPACTAFSTRTPDPDYYPVNNSAGEAYRLAYYFVDDVRVDSIEIPDFTISGYDNSCTSGSVYTSSFFSSILYYSWEILPSAQAGVFVTPSSGIGLSSVTINWNEANFPAWPGYVTLKLTITNGYATIKTYEYKIYRCCHTENLIKLNNDTIPSGVTLTYADQNFEINGTLEIFGTLIIIGNQYNGSNIKLGRLARINVHPGGSMVVEGKVTLENGCYYMWDGIYAEDPSSIINISWLPDAIPIVKASINGLVSKNGGKITAKGCHFNQNFNSISISDYYPGHPQYYGDLEVEITGNTFRNTLDASGSCNLQIPPYVGVLPNSGILVSQAIVKIGDDLETINVFENLQRGIYSINSDIKVYNTYFYNIPPIADHTYSWPYRQAAIVADVESNEKRFLVPSTIVGSDKIDGVSFIDCKVGISTQGTQAGIFNCVFQDCNFPVHVLNPLFPTEVTNCNISKFQSNPVYDIAGTGISVISANPSVTEAKEKVYILNNEISGMQHGIHCCNQNNVSNLNQVENIIQGNDISFIYPLPPNARNYRDGILIKNCDGININNNSVSYAEWVPNNLLNYNGLRISRSPGSLVYQNEFYKLDAGIYTNGELQNTQFACNKFDNCWNGLFFGKYTAMTDQHFEFEGDFYCNNNQWIGTYGFTGNHYKFTQDIGQTNLINNFDYYYDPTLSNGYWPDGDLINVNNHYCINFIGVPTDVDQLLLCPSVDEADSSSTGIDTTKRSYLFGDIIEEQIIYDTLMAQNRYYEKDYLFTYLKRNPEFVVLGGDEDIVYQNFLDSMYNTNSDYIQRVYEFMQNNRLDSASFYNEMINNADLWIYNRVTVNDLYMTYWANDDFEISEKDSLALLDIALQTPYEGGDGVYTARVMLNLFDVESQGTPYSSVIKEQAFPKFRAWPNPANDLINIELPGNDESNVYLEIRGADGRLVKQITLPENAREFSFSCTDLDNGCYFMQAKSSKNVLGIAKICVIR